MKPMEEDCDGLTQLHLIEKEGVRPDYVVLGEPTDKPRLAAKLRSPATGLQLNVHTTQPGLQFYTADYLAAPFAPRAGLCLEAQAFPDAPNQPGFPSPPLAPTPTTER